MKTALAAILGFVAASGLYVAALVGYFSHMASAEIPVLAIVLSLWFISLPLFLLTPLVGAIGAIAAGALWRANIPNRGQENDQ